MSPPLTIALWRVFRQCCACLLGIFLVLMSIEARAATGIPFSIALSEPVTVTGTPRIQLNVGGVTRYATYASGSGTATLTFTYATQAGDVDLDGIAVSSPIDLNGGSITDLAGNALSSLTFTVPNTAGIKVNYPAVAMDFINSDYILSGTHFSTLPSFLTAAGGGFSRSSVATYYDASGVLQTAASGVPRFDYDPVTHAAKGILIEDSRTNYLIYSNTFTDSSWVKANATITINAAVSPDGTSDASLINETFANSPFFIAQNYAAVLGTTYTLSIYAKASTATVIQLLGGGTPFGLTMYANFDLSAGTVSFQASSVLSSSITPVGNGWYRCAIVGTAIASSSVNTFVIALANNTPLAARVPAYSGSGRGAYIFGAQMEAGTFASTYIPHASASITRQADTLTIPTGAWLNATTGSVVTQSNSSGMSSAKFPGLFDVNLSGTERFGGYYGVSGNSVVAEQRSSGTSRVASRNGSFTGIELKAAMAFDATGPHLSTNGSGASASSAGGFPPSVSTLKLGWFDDRLNGTLSSFRYYPARVADAQLQLLTQ